MTLNLEGFSPEVQKEVNVIVEHLAKEFGCVSTFNKGFSGTEYIAIDVTLPDYQEIFLPSTRKLGVFKIDIKKKLMTLMYFPEVKDKAEVLAN